MLEELRKLNDPEINKLLKKMETLDDPSILLDKLEEIDTRLSELDGGVLEVSKVILSLKEEIQKVSDTIPEKGNPGKDGEDYILTESDKKEIAELIDVPVVEKIIEKTEVIKEQPIFNETIKEITNNLENKDTPEQVRDKLETLKEDNRLDASAIKGLDKLEGKIQDRALEVLDQRTQFLINKRTPTPTSTFTALTDTPSSYTGQAAKTVAVKVDETGLEFVANVATDEKVKYDASDPTAGYIADKFVAGTGITVAEGTGANENKLVITNSSTGSITNNTYQYSSIASPQLFNPDATAVTNDTDDYTLANTNSVAFISLNGKVLDDAEYSLVSTTLTVTPVNGFNGTDDEVLVYQHSWAVTGSGGFTMGYVAKTATYTITAGDYVVDCTANSFTVTLPSAVGLTNQHFIIKNSGSGIITVEGDGSETIDGNLNISLYQYNSLTVVSDGTNFIII